MAVCLFDLIQHLFLSTSGKVKFCGEPSNAVTTKFHCLHLSVCVLLAVNEKTTKVIEAAFQHARYPSMKGEKSLHFIGQVKYGLDK